MALGGYNHDAMAHIYIKTQYAPKSSKPPKATENQVFAKTFITSKLCPAWFRKVQIKL